MTVSLSHCEKYSIKYNLCFHMYRIIVKRTHHALWQTKPEHNLLWTSFKFSLLVNIFHSRRHKKRAALQPSINVSLLPTDCKLLNVAHCGQRHIQISGAGLEIVDVFPQLWFLNPQKVLFSSFCCLCLVWHFCDSFTFIMNN